MAAVDEISVKLGVNIAELKTALAAAGVEVKKFKKDGETGDSEGFVGSLKKMQQGLNLFKTLLVGGGIVAAFRAVFDAAVTYAENYKGAADDAVSATLRLRDAQKDLSSTIGKVAVSVVGAMESVGLAIGTLVYGSDAAADAVGRMAAEAKKAFDAEAVKKLTEATVKLAEVQHDAALAIATDNGKIGILAGDYMKLLAEQAKLQKGTLEWTEKTIVVEAKRGELQKQELDTLKKEREEKQKLADDAKKEADDEAKLDGERTKKRALDAKEDSELFLLQRKRIETLTVADVARKKELEAQHIALQKQEDVTELLEKKNTEGLTPAEAKQLEELLKQKKALDAQLAAKTELANTTATAQLEAEQEITAEMQLQLDIIKDEEERKRKIEASKNISVGRTGKDYASQSQVALEGVLGRLNTQIDAMRIDNSFATQFSPNAKNPLLYGLQTELFAVEKELAQRRTVQDTVSRLGEDAARRTFGDTLTDNALREMQDSTTRTAVILGTIEQRLAASPLFANK